MGERFEENLLISLFISIEVKERPTVNPLPYFLKIQMNIAKN